METFGNKIGGKTSKFNHNKFVCKFCNYVCSKKYNLERHLLTSKHTNAINGNQMETKKEQNEQHICVKCNKTFNHRSGLWKHKKNII